MRLAGTPERKAGAALFGCRYQLPTDPDADRADGRWIAFLGRGSEELVPGKLYFEGLPQHIGLPEDVASWVKSRLEAEYGPFDLGAFYGI